MLAVIAGVVAVLAWAGLAGGTQPYETYLSAVSTDSPVAQFRFSDAVGSGTVADSVGTFSATNTGITLGGEGPFGGSKSGLFGTESFATLPSSPLSSATEFSAEAWVNWAGGSSFKQPIFDFGSSSSNYMYLTPASSLTGNTMLFEIHTTAGTVAKVTATKLAEKTWKYVAVTETSTGTLILYVNGVEVGKSTGATISPSSLGSSPTDYLGKSLVTADPKFKGSLSNVAFYKTALSATRILAHYNAAEYPVNTAVPTITGTAKEGETLKAKEGTWSGVTPFTYTYQWQRCNASSECSNIASATSAEYKPKAEDVGLTLRVVVTAKNSAGTGEANSAKTATVAGVPPTNKEKPVISGSAKVGQLLTVSNGVWNGTPATKYTYKWESCGGTCKAITGATESSYRVTSAQLGEKLQAVVTDENPAGSASATSLATAAVTTGPPVNIALPVVSGSAVEGATLTASTGTWAGTEPITYTYKWQSCNNKGESCTNISGATSSTYVLTAGNVGGTVRVEVLAKNSVSSVGAFSAVTAVVTVKPPENTALPTISGTAKEGETLTASAGTWAGTEPITYTYQWRSCNSAGESCSNISGATSSTYKLVAGDVGHRLRVIVAAKNAGGITEATSAATSVVVTIPVNTALPVISGSVEDGKLLKASTGSWTGEPFSYAYQWQRCNNKGEACSNISGATKGTYASKLADVGATIRVAVTATNAAGSSAPASSTATAVITAATPPANTSLPSISGSVKDGVTLSANVGSWSGSTPLTYTYQWQSCTLGGGECQSIEGATSSNYALSTSDLGTTLRVVVTASNVAGSAEATSAATAEVEPGAPSELEAPSIAGSPYVGQTLYASTGAWGGTETEASYQWEQCNAAGSACASIAGATGPQYTLEEGNIEGTVRLRVGVSNPLGSLTAVSSTTEVISWASSLASTSPPSITGTPVNGQVLTANAGSWLGTATIGYAYQWQLCNAYGGGCENLAGATASTYVLGSGSLGHTLRVRVSASETGGAASQTSPATQPIAAEGAPESVGAPAVSGTGLVGHVLSATPGAWSGEGSIGYSYQWQRCGESGEGCTAISGATASTYTLAEADKGAALRVLVTATDEGGSTVAASNATAAISPTTLVNVVAPSIAGSYQLGRALSANSGIWTAEGALAYTYQWERCNEKGEACSTISGATEFSYTPVSADVGNTLRTVVTATGAAGKISVTSGVTPVIASVPFAPEDLLVPTIEGNLTVGETLTAQPGTWVSSEAISYSYQWQTCNEEGEACSNITGATASTYKLVEGNIGATLRVVVTGKNTLGSNSATSEQTAETVGAVGPPANTNRPVISGLAKQGERLVAGNGSWSGSRPLSYYYRWERCNTAGESCTAIEGATKPSYTVASADVGSTLRVKVTATNSLGSAGAISTQTIVTAGGETNATAAIELVEKTDPSVLQAATTATLEGQEVKPVVSDTGESLTATTALTSSSVSKETPGEIAVNTPDGELSFAPVSTAPNATKTPTIVNNAAAVFANTSTATDTIVRPDALGATTLVQLHSSVAPTSYSWEVGLGPDQRLEKLASGAIAVVEIPTSSPLEGSLGEGFGSSEPSEAAAEHEGSGANGEASELALEEGISEEGPLGKLPAAPQTTTPTVEPKPGELHPQETKAQYESAKSTVASAEEHVTGTTLMVIEPPTVMDAKGSTVPASLSLENNTVTMTLSPGGGTTYPVTAEANIAAPSNQASAAKAHHIRYALDDPEPSTFTTFDSHLTTGPLHVGIARDVIPYNTAPTNPKLLEWLKAVKAAGLQPFITFGVSGAQYCLVGHPCHQTSIGSYEKYVTAMIAGLKKRHAEEPGAIPPVTLWGAWNEPDWHAATRENPLNHNPKRAALFWKKARAILRQVGCSCTMVAGEFAQDDNYIAEYAATIQRNHSFWSGKPHVWGMHDYVDLENYYHHPHNSYAEAFLKKIRRLGASRVWFSEQGVALQNGSGLTKLGNSSQSEDANRQREAAKDFLRLGSVHLQKELSNVEMVDYYLYRGPTKKEEEERHEPYAFDSGLLPGVGIVEENHHPAENPRQAYCVLALGLTGCPATAKTKSAVAGTTTESASMVALDVVPQGLPTKYLVEYGSTEAYGKTTTTFTLPNVNGEQSETPELGGLEPCTTYHYQAEAENAANEGKPGLGGDQTFQTGGCVATSVSVSGMSACASLSAGGVDCWGSALEGELGNGFYEGTFSRAPAIGISSAKEVSGNSGNVCALLTSGSVDCWGPNSTGELGNGTSENSATPVPVKGITSAKAVAAGGHEACAVLTAGTVECWGDNSRGELGTGTETGPENNCVTGFTTEDPCSRVPVKVQGITNATAVAVGNWRACALLATGHIDCWGSNFEGALGDNKSNNSSTPIEVSGITNAVTVAAGGPDNCAVLSTGSVDCWGANGEGALGDGTETGPEKCEGSPCSRVPVAVSGITNATNVAVGYEEGCARLSTGHVKCWGSNFGGALGNGFTGSEKEKSTTPVEVSGLTTAVSVSVSLGPVPYAILTGGALDRWGGGNTTPAKVPGFP
jgi:alpha-tubulin suppressor-like RCC1 family protein